MKDGKFKAWWNQCEKEMISMSQAWDKQDSNLWPPKHRAGVLSTLSHGELMESKAMY